MEVARLLQIDKIKVTPRDDNLQRLRGEARKARKINQQFQDPEIRKRTTEYKSMGNSLKNCNGKDSIPRHDYNTMDETMTLLGGIDDVSDCNTAQLLLESSSKAIACTVIKPEKTFNETAPVAGEENSSKYEKCFDGSYFDISKANIIELSKNFVNGTKKNVRNQGKGSLLKDTFEKIDPNLSPIDVKKYNCEGYNKLFSNMINLKRHIVTDRGLRPHRCDICGKCFKQTSVLNYHILTHGGQRLICDVCGKCFKRKDYLKSHILTHSGKKPHKCDVCGKSFLRKDYLKLHFFNHNDQKRTNKCEVCGKCFTSSYSLKVHHLIHSGLKPHKCDICDKCFTKKSHLKIHLRIHNKSKPLNCGICGKSFYRNDHLKNHLLTHNEHSPLKCDVCGKCFNLKRILKIHMLTHIKQRP
uniref:C2H2-type domain-containing protein n=1 Tax=Timema monikensis TaxID=170555 RepID=A0A7R9HMA4_9NEOP|nr:unnamed protein product [Timema monikensis]